jgi:phosphopentomutase
MRIVVVVIDSGGIGAAPDAARFGDSGANTITHALEVAPRPLPALAGLGLGALCALPGAPPEPLAGAARRVHPAAAGKDTLAGHWEMMGQIVREPFRTYPDGFPPDVIERLEAAFGRPVLGNRPASGTAIIAELGAEHLRTGYPIVYTSADSVLQIAAHEDVVPLEQLYAWCRAARDIMMGPHLVGRIIARPFVGEPGHFVRTPHRHDYAVAPADDIYPVVLAAHGVETVAIGKIWDIFSGRGFSAPHPTGSNREGLAETLRALRHVGERAFIFTNLVDFDSSWGHRRDPVGYVNGLAELDAWIPEALALLRDDDQLWITADHGCDPTWPGSDHTREDSPWLVAGPRVRPGVLPPADTLADLAATLAEAFGTPPPPVGRSRWQEVRGYGLS